MAEDDRINPQEVEQVETTAKRMAFGSLTRISPADLLPGARKKYDDLLRNNEDSRGTIVIVDSRQTGDFQRFLFRTENDTPFIIVPESARHWTEADAKNKLHDLDETKEILRAKPHPDKRLQDELEAMAKKLGIPTPQLLTASRNNLPEKNVGVSLATSNGTGVIILDPSLSFDEAKAIMAHEIGHIANGDYTPANIAARHNDETHDSDFAIERRADSRAAELCQGPQLANIFQAGQQDGRDKAKGKNKSLAEYEAELDPKHPTLGERINFLRQGAIIEQTAGRCPVDPSLISPSVAQSMQRIRGGEHVEENTAPLGAGAEKTGFRDRQH